jgi:hypothetical protein
MPAPWPPGNEPFEQTQFRARFEEFARREALPMRDGGYVLWTVEELRRYAGEFFSWGAVHQTAFRARLDKMLPEEPERPDVVPFTYTPTAPRPCGKKPSQRRFFQK